MGWGGWVGIWWQRVVCRGGWVDVGVGVQTETKRSFDTKFRVDATSDAKSSQSNIGNGELSLRGL